MMDCEGFKRNGYKNHMSYTGSVKSGVDSVR